VPASPLSGSHFSARGRACSTGGDAYVHIANAFAIIRAFGADFRALSACVLMVRSVDEHEVGRCPTDLGASHYQTEMVGLDVFTAGFQAMIHRGTETCLVAIQAGLDASVHVF
jgi:hypothetical protein